jgi:hydrogenase nickel incorporation protein HypB
MCDSCGCGDTTKHEHHSHPESKGKEVALEQKVLAHNDHLAEHNREHLAKANVVALNLISSPGSGKTALLEVTLDALKDKIKSSVIVGDQQSDLDAQRLENRGAVVRQIETGNSCHLNAEQVHRQLPDVLTDDCRLLFIENVGNLICPAAFYLGESLKIGLLSVTEGEDKPIKYPVLFSAVDLVIITKTDLLEHLDFDMEECKANLAKVCPNAKVIELSSKTGQGIDSWLAYLDTLVD